MTSSISKLAMLRATPRLLRLLTRHALRQPPAPPAHHQLPTVVIALPRSSCPPLSRLSQPPHWRAFHSTRARFSDKTTSGSEKHGRDFRRDWGAISYEPIDDLDGVKTFIALCVLGYFAYLEIPKHLPVRTNPNYLLKESLEIINQHPEVTDRLGTPITGQGERVRFWHQVEFVKIKGAEGRPSRLRYYLTGPNGTASVFAEVIEGTKKGEYNYLVVQFDDTKEVVPVIDHRDIHAIGSDHKTDHEAPPPKVSKVLSDVGGRSERI